MRRVLLTGMSGAGKSTLTAALAARGYRAIDLDCAEYSEWRSVAPSDTTPGTPVEATRDWVWREDRVRELLRDESAQTLFVSGTASNMRLFLPDFDAVVLLSAPAEVLAQRLGKRGHGEYGSRPAELQRVLELVRSVEPLLRRASTHELDTRASIDDVVRAITTIAGGA